MSLTGIDMGLLVVLLLFLLRGIHQGFLKELVNLVLWLVAFIVPLYLSPILTEKFPTLIQNAQLRQIIFFIVLLCLSWIIMRLVKWIVFFAVSQTDIAWPSRIAGGFLATGKGIVMIFMAVWLLSFTQVAKFSMWQHSLALPVITHFTQQWLDSHPSQQVEKVKQAQTTIAQQEAENARI